MKEIVLIIVSAHFIGDFLLQPDWLQRRKSSLWAIVLHTGIVASLSYLLLQQWSAWILPVLIWLTHAWIDAIKSRCRDTWRSFCIDQAAHVLSLVGLVWLCWSIGWVAPFRGIGLKWMVVLAGFAGAVQGAGFLVGKVSDQLQRDNQLVDRIDGLKNGGRIIGLLERALIFLFILIGQPAGIGFLVAAKSILRFGEARDDQKLAEYVLIGTLLSFGLAIVAASGARLLMQSL